MLDDPQQPPLMEPAHTSREVWFSRIVCLGFALAVILVELRAWTTGSAAWHTAFLVGFVLLCVLTTLVAQIPRRVQRKRDRDWATRLHELAIRDELTGLYNRRHFNASLELAARAEDSVTVAVVDLDGFKRINDTLGHAAGDLALRVAAAALRNAAPEGLVARVGGDEFAVIMWDLAPGEEHALARGLTHALAVAPFVVSEEAGIRLSGSVGVARPQPGMDPEAIIQEADRALYRAKDAHALRAG